MATVGLLNRLEYVRQYYEGEVELPEGLVPCVAVVIFGCGAVVPVICEPLSRWVAS